MLVLSQAPIAGATRPFVKRPMFDQWLMRRRRITPIVGDVLLTLLVALLSLGAVGAHHWASNLAHGRIGGPTSWEAIAVTLLGTLPLLVRRRYPLAVLGATEVAEAIYLAIGPLDSAFNGLAMAVALYTVATRTDRRTSIIVAALVGCVNELVMVVDLLLGRTVGGHNVISMAVLVIGSWSLGNNVRTRRAYLAQLEERARRLELEREENTRRAVQEERAHIARELHDVVAHHVSAIAVQAGAAAEIAERNPQRARDALRLIQATSREALAEMRTLLNVLHSGDELGGDRSPQPSLEHVDRLASQSRAAGLPVTIEVEGSRRPLPEALDVTAYRIVQEALTNSLKHAGPARAHVLLRFGADALELEVADDGRGAPAGGNGSSEGRGLIGMRERVALFGGELSAGSANGRGFVVQARLPLRST
jgi:signal transduction histidine kinase